MDERITRRNPDNKTYRVPIYLAGEFRCMGGKTTQAIFGDIVNRLGQYEDCLSLEEAKEMKK